MKTRTAPPPKGTTDVSLLEVRVGTMIQTHYAPREYHEKCGERYLGFHPEAQHRSISLYEVLESWRDYMCGLCNRKIWDVEDHK